MKRCREDMIFDTVVFILLTVILIVVAYPLYWVIISSISDPAAVSGGKVLWKPIGFTLKGYVEVFKNNAVMKGFLNSIIYTVCGVCINLIVTLGRLMQLRADTGKRREINNGIPSHSLPDTGPNVNMAPVLFFSHEIDGIPSEKPHYVVNNTNRG